MGVFVSTPLENLIEGIVNRDEAFLNTSIEDIPEAHCRKLLSSPIPHDPDGRTPLHFAAVSDKKILSILLDLEPNVNCLDLFGWSPFMLALNQCCLDNSHLLAEKSTNFDPKDERMPLIFTNAVMNQSTGVVSLMLQLAVDPMLITSYDYRAQDGTETTILHTAVDTMHVTIARLLLEKGNMNVNITNSKQWTPLHLASANNDTAMIRMLIEKGANVNNKDHQGNSPLAWANAHGSHDAAEQLKQYEAVCDPVWHGSQPPWLKQDPERETPLDSEEEEFRECEEYATQQSELLAGVTERPAVWGRLSQSANNNGRHSMLGSEATESSSDKRTPDGEPEPIKKQVVEKKSETTQRHGGVASIITKTTDEAHDGHPRAIIVMDKIVENVDLRSKGDDHIKPSPQEPEKPADTDDASSSKTAAGGDSGHTSSKENDNENKKAGDDRKSDVNDSEQQRKDEETGQSNETPRRIPADSQDHRTSDKGEYQDF